VDECKPLLPGASGHQDAGVADPALQDPRVQRGRRGHRRDAVPRQGPADDATTLTVCTGTLEHYEQTFREEDAASVYGYTGSQ